MSITPNYVPRHFKTINIILSVNDVESALDFYNRAFGADVVNKFVTPDGITVHAEIKIDDTIVMIGKSQERIDESQTSPVVIQIYTGDVEGFFEEAEKAGAVVLEPVEKQFYGDRSGKLRDPFGFVWMIATHMDDFTYSELQHRFHDLYT